MLSSIVRLFSLRHIREFITDILYAFYASQNYYSIPFLIVYLMRTLRRARHDYTDCHGWLTSRCTESSA